MSIIPATVRSQLQKHVKPEDNSITASIRRINRFRYRYPDQEMENTIGHVFFSKPNMNFFEADEVLNPQIRNHDCFIDLYNSPNHGMPILQTLCAPRWGGGLPGPYMDLIHNYAENFELPDLNIKTVQSSKSKSGFSISMGGRYEVAEGPTTSIKYLDDRKLSIYKLHKAWVDYIHLVTQGKIEAKKQYIVRREIDYAVSAYFFLCAENGIDILFWAKYTGMFPINVPNSTFSWQKGNFNKPEIAIEYKYFGPPDIMRPITLADFNNIGRKHGGLSSGSFTPKPMYQQDSYSMFDPWCQTPAVTYNRNKEMYELHMS